MPEFIQDAAVPSVMASAGQATAGRKRSKRCDNATFDEIHQLLKKSVAPGAEAAKAVLGLCESIECIDGSISQVSMKWGVDHLAGRCLRGSSGA